MVNHEVILRKVTELKEYVNELRQADDISWENIRGVFVIVPQTGPKSRCFSRQMRSIFSIFLTNVSSAVMSVASISKATAR